VPHRDGSVSLGATGVPYLRFEHYATFEDDLLSQKLDPYRRRYAGEYALVIPLALLLLGVYLCSMFDFPTPMSPLSTTIFVVRARTLTFVYVVAVSLGRPTRSTTLVIPACHFKLYLIRNVHS
jgi:hypothetical protein